MSYMKCQQCGGHFGTIGMTFYTCGCGPRLYNTGNSIAGDPIYSDLPPTLSLPEAVAGNASAPVGEKRQPSGVGEPRGIDSRPAMLIGESAGREMHLSASGYCSQCNMLVEFGTNDCPHAKTLHGKKPTSSQTEGASSPADARTELVQKEVGEGLREALIEVTNAFMWSLSESNDVIDDGTGNWHCIHCDSLGGGASFDHAPNCMYLKGMKALHKARKLLSDTAALAAPAPELPVPGPVSDDSIHHGPFAPAPKPAPPAEPLNVKEYLDLALRIQRVGAEHPYKLEQAGVNQGMWVCQCGEVLGDQPIDEIDAVAEQHISKFVAELVRRAAERTD